VQRRTRRCLQEPTEVVDSGQVVPGLGGLARSCDELGGPLGASAFPGRFGGVKKPGNPIRRVSRQLGGTRVRSRRKIGIGLPSRGRAEADELGGNVFGRGTAAAARCQIARAGLMLFSAAASAR
jgi:hypothetical protein